MAGESQEAQPGAAKYRSLWILSNNERSESRDRRISRHPVDEEGEKIAGNEKGKPNQFLSIMMNVVKSGNRRTNGQTDLNCPTVGRRGE